MVAQEFPEDWEYSGGELEKTLKVEVQCPYCKHKFTVEIGESWYNIGFSITCPNPKCGRSFPINQYGRIVGVVGQK